MRVFTANYIIPITSEPIKNGFLVCEEDGTIKGVYKQLPQQFSRLKIEQYEGWLCPGFVNTHCHLELSHLKNKIPEQTGLAGFIKEVQAIREATEQEMQQAFLAADTEMYNNGIIAVGDICNTANTLKVKKQSKLYYHNFVEVFGLTPEKENANLSTAKNVKQKLVAATKSSLTPHANYSVSGFLFNEISKEKQDIITIHNQESAAENEFFENKSGAIYEQLQKFGIDLSNWSAPKKSALKSILPKLNKQSKIQLVHNSFTSKDDIEFAESYSNNIFWCFCPNANLYIENTLPNIPKFEKEGCKIVFGTDSLASNWQLSILEELKTIRKRFPNINSVQLLKYACLNSAEYLGLSGVLGSFVKGKRPGVVQITNIDFSQMQITSKSKSYRVF